MRCSPLSELRKYAVKLPSTFTWLAGNRAWNPEGAAGASLAREAVTDRDPDGIAFRRQLELPAIAGGIVSDHRHES